MHQKGLSSGRSSWPVWRVATRREGGTCSYRSRIQPLSWLSQCASSSDESCLQPCFCWLRIYHPWRVQDAEAHDWALDLSHGSLSTWSNPHLRSSHRWLMNRRVGRCLRRACWRSTDSSVGRALLTIVLKISVRINRLQMYFPSE